MMCFSLKKLDSAISDAETHTTVVSDLQRRVSELQSDLTGANEVSCFFLLYTSRKQN